MQLTHPLHEDSPQWEWFKRAVVTTIKKNGKVDYDTKIRLTSTIIWCLGAFDVVRKTINLTYQGKVAPWNAKYDIVEKKTREKYPNTLKGRIALNKVLFAFFRASQVISKNNTGVESVSIFGTESGFRKFVAGAAIVLSLGGGKALAIGNTPQTNTRRTVAEIAFGGNVITKSRTITKAERERRAKAQQDAIRLQQNIDGINRFHREVKYIGDSAVYEMEKEKTTYNKCALKRASDSGKSMIQLFEGFKAKAYKDSTGTWTIGNGHTGSLKEIGINRNVQEGDIITKEQALKLMMKGNGGIEYCERAVKRYFKDVSLTQTQFDALVSVAYNIGCENLRTSKLAQEIKKGPEKWNDATIKSNFAALNKSRTKIKQADGTTKTVLKANAGLTKRRNLEYNLFKDGKYPTKADL